VSIADDATVSIVLADFANEDVSKKINMLGAGWQLTGLGPNGVTAEAAIVVLVQVPSQYRGQQFAIGLTLLNEAGDPVSFPSPSGEPMPLRIQQLCNVDPPVVPGIHVPNHVPSSVQIVLRLGNGLPLPPNQLYTWSFEIDGNKKSRLSFYVAGPPPGPVLG
jgi:hypothetical protein